MGFTDFSKYSGHQQIINSDRIIINAKDDSVFVIGKETIGLSANEGVHINTDEHIINANKIQFGLSENGDIQPITKADTLENILNDILNSLTNFSSQLSSAAGMGAGVVTLPTINAAGVKLLQDVQRIKVKVKNIKSKTTFTI